MVIIKHRKPVIQQKRRVTMPAVAVKHLLALGKTAVTACVDREVVEGLVCFGRVEGEQGDGVVAGGGGVF